MKFNGNSLSTRNHKEVKFRRGDEVITLIVSSVPTSFITEMVTKGAYCQVKVPEKPKELRPNIYAKDKDGKVVFFEDFHDPDYVANRNKNLARFSALRLWYGLRHDPSMSWEAQKPADNASAEDWAKFSDALVKEITDPMTGFEDGEVSKIVAGIDACDLMDADDVPDEEQALKLF